MFGMHRMLLFSGYDLQRQNYNAAFCRLFAPVCAVHSGVLYAVVSGQSLANATMVATLFSNDEHDFLGSMVSKLSGAGVLTGIVFFHDHLPFQPQTKPTKLNKLQVPWQPTGARWRSSPQHLRHPAKRNARKPPTRLQPTDAHGNQLKLVTSYLLARNTAVSWAWRCVSPRMCISC